MIHCLLEEVQNYREAPYRFQKAPATYKVWDLSFVRENEDRWAKRSKLLKDGR